MGAILMNQSGGVSTKTIPPQGLNLTLKGGNGQIDCTFTGITSQWLYLGQYYRLIAKPGSAPTSPMDGVQIKDVQVGAIGDAVISASITGLTNGVQYYVRLYVRGDNGWQTSVDAVGTATPMAGIAIGALAVGAKIEIPVKSGYQSQFGTKIVFRIADKNHSGYPANSVTLITDKIIQLLAFDGKEPSNANSDRKQYGNNNYNYSNIRQWLNSNAGAGSWYSAKHSADAPPNSSNVSVNAYDARAGFLAIFDTQFVNALMNTTLTVVKNTVTDGGSYETVTDKVFLASTTEVGLANENSIAEGTKLALFTNDASRVAYCTQEAINTSTYTSDPTTSDAWYWWLRTPYSSNARYVRNVRADGTVNYNNAYYGDFGVRPLCNLPADFLLAPEPNPDGSYSPLTA